MRVRPMKGATMVRVDVVSPETTEAVVELGRLSLAFARVNRITCHEDGITPESDTDHTVMLGLIGCAFAAQHFPNLNIGLVAQYAMIHDLVEVYAGDTPTLRQLSTAGAADKATREHAAYLQIAAEFDASLPWLSNTIADYEARTTPEARYVKAMDKLLPKITHLLNGGSTLHAQGMSSDELRARYDTQLGEMQEYAADFPTLFALRAQLIDFVLGIRA